MAENSETCMVANLGTVEVNGAPLMPVVRCRLSLYGEKPDTNLFVVAGKLILDFVSKGL